MCNHDDLILCRNISSNIATKVINNFAPVMVCLTAWDIMSLPLDSLKMHLRGLDKDTAIMINIKSPCKVDMAIIGEPVTFADDVEITASELVHLLDKGDMKGDTK